MDNLYDHWAIYGPRGNIHMLTIRKFPGQAWEVFKKSDWYKHIASGESTLYKAEDLNRAKCHRIRIIKGATQ